MWPFALKDSEDRSNRFRLDKNSLAPIHTFSKFFTNVEIKYCHTWGFPVFVLEAKAQIVHLSKWDPKARVCIYLGHSSCHARSVTLVLNLNTLHFSPQFHVVFDDKFSTVPYMLSGEVPPRSNELVTHSRESTTDENIYIANTWETEDMNYEGD